MSPNQQEPPTVSLPTVSFSHSQALPVDASPHEFRGCVWALHYLYLLFMLMSPFHCKMTSCFSTAPPLPPLHLSCNLQHKPQTHLYLIRWLLPPSIGTSETQTLYNLTPKFRWFQTLALTVTVMDCCSGCVPFIIRLPSSQNSTIPVPWHLQPKLLLIQSPAHTSVSQQVNQLIWSFKIPLLYKLYYRCFL